MLRVLLPLRFSIWPGLFVYFFLIRVTFEYACFRYHIPNRLRAKDQADIAEKMGYGNITNLCFDRRLYIKEISKAERSKQDSYLQVAAAAETSVPPMGMMMLYMLHTLPRCPLCRHAGPPHP